MILGPVWIAAPDLVSWRIWWVTLILISLFIKLFEGMTTARILLDLFLHGTLIAVFCLPLTHVDCKFGELLSPLGDATAEAGSQALECRASALVQCNDSGQLSCPMVDLVNTAWLLLNGAASG